MSPEEQLKFLEMLEAQEAGKFNNKLLTFQEGCVLLDYLERQAEGDVCECEEQEIEKIIQESQQRTEPMLDKARETSYDMIRLCEVYLIEEGLIDKKNYWYNWNWSGCEYVLDYLVSRRKAGVPCPHEEQRLMNLIARAQREYVLHQVHNFVTTLA